MHPPTMRVCGCIFLGIIGTGLTDLGSMFLNDPVDCGARETYMRGKLSDRQSIIS